MKPQETHLFLDFKAFGHHVIVLPLWLNSTFSCQPDQVPPEMLASIEIPDNAPPVYTTSTSAESTIQAVQALVDRLGEYLESLKTP